MRRREELPTSHILWQNGFREIMDVGRNPYNLPETKMVYVDRNKGRVMIPVDMKNFPDICNPDEAKEED